MVATVDCRFTSRMPIMLAGVHTFVVPGMKLRPMYHFQEYCLPGVYDPVERAKPRETHPSDFGWANSTKPLVTGG